MSRYYKMNVEIDGFNPKKQAVIVDKLQYNWNFDAHDTYKDSKHGTVLWLVGEGNLTGGYSEEKFAVDAAKAVWEANGGFCNVSVKATYLEELPYETYEFNKEDYKELMKNKENDN